MLLVKSQVICIGEDIACTHTLSEYVVGGVLRAVRSTMVKTVMRKSASTAPITAPAMAMEDVICF